MEKIVFFAWILVVSTSTILQAQSQYYSASHPYKPTPEKKTHLRFYFHDTLSGKNPTAVQIAGPISATDPLPFGSTFAIDDPLTEGPEITSRVIGNARGIYVVTNQDRNLTLVLYADLGFTSGAFRGSSLSVFSRNTVEEKVREMAVVGGTGRFRMARGFVLETTHYVNPTTGDSVLEYNVEVVHH